MVRRVGGTIHQSVPSTADSVRQIKGQESIQAPSYKNLDSFNRKPKGKTSLTQPQESEGKRSGRLSFLPQKKEMTVKNDATAFEGKLDTKQAGKRSSILVDRNMDGKSSSITPKADPAFILGAKPSEIRAAVKQNRDVTTKQGVRKNHFQKREEEAAIRMTKIRNEINTTKQIENEGENDVDIVVEKFDFKGLQSLAKSLESKVAPITLENVKGDHKHPIKRQVDRRRPVEHFSKPRKKLSNADKKAAQKNTKALALEELVAERSSIKKDEAEKRRTHHKSCNQEMKEMVAPFDVEDMPADEFNALQRFTADAPQLPRNLLNSRSSTRVSPLSPEKNRMAPLRTPSNLIPEMRRRANQRDLLYDGAESKSKNSRLAKSSARNEDTGAQRSLLDLEQKTELYQAQVTFQRGHDLCWKEFDSKKAIIEYRRALFTRESILGKYHETTGRTYFWIGKSLAKLKEYEEALVAFSRAYRVFTRVLNKSSKYNVWTLTAIQNLFREMEDSGSFFIEYKRHLESSIEHEHLGDQYRKRGALEKAVDEYNLALEQLDSTHPDAADLRCKVAVIFRQQGAFDEAMQEYGRAAKIYELSLGTEHPDTVSTLNQLIQKKHLDQKSRALEEKLKFSLKKG